MSFFNYQGEVTHIPTLIANPYDTLGCMDTIASIIALSLPSCISKIVDAVHLANIGLNTNGNKKDYGLLTRNDLVNQIGIISEYNAV